SHSSTANGCTYELRSVQSVPPHVMLAQPSKSRSGHPVHAEMFSVQFALHDTVPPGDPIDWHRRPPSVAPSQSSPEPIPPSQHPTVHVQTLGCPVHAQPGSTWHSDEQPSPLTAFPSSHVWFTWMRPSPQGPGHVSSIRPSQSLSSPSHSSTANGCTYEL